MGKKSNRLTAIQTVLPFLLEKNFERLSGAPQRADSEYALRFFLRPTVGEIFAFEGPVPGKLVQGKSPG